MATSGDFHMATGITDSRGVDLACQIDTAWAPLAECGSIEGIAEGRAFSLGVVVEERRVTLFVNERQVA